jgi:hemoglobin
MHKSGLARQGFVAMFLICTLGSCTTPPPEERAQAPSSSLYQRLGGRPAIAMLVDDAIVNIAADPRINQRFRSANAQHLTSNLVDLLCMRAGGPCVYSGRNMADAHDMMHIRDDEFDALIEDLVMSFDKFKVPAPEQREAMIILDQMRSSIVGH